MFYLPLSIPFHFLFYYSLKSWVDRLSFSFNFNFSTAYQFFNSFFHLFLLLCFIFWKISLALIPMSLVYFKFPTFYLFLWMFLFILPYSFHEHKIFSYASEDINYRLLKSVWSPHCFLWVLFFSSLCLFISLSVSS